MTVNMIITFVFGIAGVVFLAASLIQKDTFDPLDNPFDEWND